MKNSVWFSLVLVFTMIGNSRAAEPLPANDQIRELMLRNWMLVQDYQVDIQLAVNIPGFRMPSRKIHYLYKAPDKSKVEVKGFAIVPKQGIQPFITFLKDSLELNVEKDSSYLGHTVYEVALMDTFMNRAGRIALLVDQQNGCVYHVQVSSEDQVFFEMNTSYQAIGGIYLPMESNITMHFPPDFKNIQRLGLKPTDMQSFDATITDEWLEGSITIQFKNYQVNQGLPDYLFEDDPEDRIQD